MGFFTGKELLELCQNNKYQIYDATIEYENEKTGIAKEAILERMMINLKIMKEAATRAFSEEIGGKIIGGESRKLRERYENTKPVCGNTMARAVSYALSTMEVNASMGKIVAAPTAGSCGVIPAVFLSLSESHQISDELLLKGLFTTSGVGIVIANNATLSGAQGGCQAEVGSASAMAAAGVVEMMGGTPEQALHAAAIALKNLMGLVCDPIAGLVEAPCTKRNAIGTSNALISAEMALAGITSVVPFDEVVEAMYKVGLSMPCSLRETSLGGVAATPTAKKIEKEIFGYNIT
ncbi:L-serine ammonia-lyase, iron-sulfur-dependent, subunit alpha [Vallitalea okinawensis]|uniref:L-serine ammonia-lyase, iron-sulfur-dependent, subunit alpha n=1 Tax=Vallitalea okinawensis TaxID=2078660 RepID=UPI000CFD71C2|nr:L-serine ammonia-lyase, iron-sulfur-dependent, subunit alpha [Vallitalea okinawensis]